MKTKILLILAFAGMSLLFPGSIFSQNRSPADVHKALQRLKERTGGKIKVEWRGDRVGALEGNLSLPYSGTPEEAAKQFLKENADIFQIPTDLNDVEVETVREDVVGNKHLGYYISFKQTYKGLLVFDGSVGVILKPDRSISTVYNAYLPNINISTTPTLAEKDAIEIVKNKYLQEDCYKRRGLGGEPIPCEGQELILKGEPQLQLGIFEHGGKPYLAYKILMDVESPRAYLQYIINANDGTVFEGGDMIRYFTGTGKVFNPNPVNTLNNTGLQDNMDQDASVFNKAYSSKTLKDLTLNNGSYYLIGPYVDVTDDIEQPFYFPSASGYIASTKGRFNFTRSQDEFEHVMAYYHIDTNQRYIQSLWFTNINNRRISVDPHGLSWSTTPNAYYNPVPIGAGYLAFGEVGVDAAEDADVILHEYGHAIQDFQAPGKYFTPLCNAEADAMGEGFGDYWAASNTYTQSIANGFDPACIGEWIDVYNPDTDGDPICLRMVDSTKRYPVNIQGECHDDGEIWSGALWDMFNSLGKTTTDKLVLLSHSIIGANNLIQNPTFCDGAKAIIQADQQLYAGANKNTIISIMKNRGIGNSPGAIKDLGTLGGTYSFAYGINNSGQVAGFSTTIADGTYHAFIWDAVNGMQDLGTLGGSWSVALGINDIGKVVGGTSVADGTGHAFIWDVVNGMQDMGTLGGSWSYAAGINNSEQIVGGATMADGKYHAFIWDVVNGMQDIGTLGGSESQAIGINDSGQVVGHSDDSTDWKYHAFIWDAVNGMQDLGTLGGTYSFAWGINDFGQVVGAAKRADDTWHAFIWDAVNGMQDLGTLGGTHSFAWGINDFGQVVGAAWTAGGYEHAVLWQACILQ